MSSGSSSSSGSSIGQTLNSALNKVVAAKAQAIATQTTAPAAAKGTSQGILSTKGAFSLGGTTGMILGVLALVVAVVLLRRR